METLTTLSDVALVYSDCRTAGISRRADVAKKVFFFKAKMSAAKCHVASSRKRTLF